MKGQYTGLERESFWFGVNGVKIHVIRFTRLKWCEVFWKSSLQGCGENCHRMMIFRIDFAGAGEMRKFQAAMGNKLQFTGLMHYGAYPKLAYSFFTTLLVLLWQKTKEVSGPTTTCLTWKLSILLPYAWNVTYPGRSARPLLPYSWKCRASSQLTKSQKIKVKSPLCQYEPIYDSLLAGSFPGQDRHASRQDLVYFTSQLRSHSNQLKNEVK